MSLSNKLFISPSVVIESMRDNGYKNTAYAVAELIDNSIQAAATEVYFVVYEKQIQNIDGSKGGKQIDKIAIIDNGSGMPPEILHAALEFGASENRKDSKGMGKFGMGLPNSSISQCRRTDVYSWQHGKPAYTTYLDIKKIQEDKQEHILYPHRTEIPDYLSLPFEGGVSNSGTAVVWSDLDKLHWKTSAALLRNTQDIIGRMYRRMINNGDVKVIFQTYYMTDDALFGSEYILDNSTSFVANDPLQLIANTTLKDIKDYPEELKTKPAFKTAFSDSFEISLNNGKKGMVTITSAMISDELVEKLRESTTGYIGNTDIGKKLKNNIGLSIMRAGRELDLIENFKIFDDKRKDRWMGVEIEFEPVLDDFFGVTNNKQSANKIKPIDMQDIMIQQGCNEPTEALDLLERQNPEDAQLVKCLNKIISAFEMSYRKVDAINLAGLKHHSVEHHRMKTDSVNLKATYVNEKSSQKRGGIDRSPTKESLEESFKDLTDKGLLSKEKVPQMIEEILENNLRVKFEEINLPFDQFFDVTVSDGFILIEINPEHTFYKNFIQNATEENKDLLKLSLAAWGHMESEAVSSDRRRQYEVVRQNWGQFLSEYMAMDEQ
ncbi:ATP-binding protein [Psychrobacter piscatorii]|uniref:ATP-binding protein n=1 Tax=Psychrobacter piscatorii TaxID=554343 RepID=UPI003736EEB5